MNMDRLINVAGLHQLICALQWVKSAIPALFGMNTAAPQLFGARVYESWKENLDGCCRCVLGRSPMGREENLTHLASARRRWVIKTHWPIGIPN